MKGNHFFIIKRKWISFFLLLSLLFQTIGLTPSVKVKAAEPITSSINGGYSALSAKPTVVNTSGKSAYSGPASPQVKWVYDLEQGSDRISYPVIGEDGSIFTITNNDRNLYSINPDGKKNFSKYLLFNGDAQFINLQIASDGSIYANRLNGIYKTDGNGKSLQVSQSYFQHIINVNGEVIGSGGGKVDALNPDGTVKWEYKTKAPSDSTARLANDAHGNIYGIADYSHQKSLLFSLDANGNERWSTYIEDNRINNNPLMIGNQIYLLMRNSLVSLDSEGNILWKKTFERNDDFTHLSGDEHHNAVYFGYENELVAIRPDGSVKWKYAADGLVLGIPAIDKEGVVYFSSDKGSFYAVTAEGKLKWNIPVEGISRTAPAINSDGTIYLNSDIGVLYAIGEVGKAPSNEITDIMLLRDEVNLKPEEETTLQLVASYSDGRKENVASTIDWTSSNNEVVTIEKGKLLADRTGSATVQGSLEEKTFTVNVSVKEPERVDPFKDKNPLYYKKKEEEAASYINKIREDMNLSPYALSESLRMSAQGHSNYKKLNGDGFVGAHYELPDGIGFIGAFPENRANYFGYQGTVGEGIARGPYPLQSMIGLLGAPYHRTDLLDPRFTEIGIGFNQSGTTVVNMGARSAGDILEPIVYPFDGQKDVPPAWFNNENPNPLEHAGKWYEYTGYPISFSIYDSNIKHIDVLNTTLNDDSNNKVDFFLVDRAVSSLNKRDIFIIPEKPLEFAKKYKVSLSYKIEYMSGKVVTAEKSWSFNTMSTDSVGLTDIYNQSKGESKYGGMLRAITNPIDLQHYTFSITSLNEKTVYSTGEVDGNTAGYSPFDLEALPKGTYKYIFRQSELGIEKKYTFKLTDDQDGVQFIGLEVGDHLPPDAPIVNKLTDKDRILTGKAEPLSTIEVFLQEKLIGNAQVDEEGSFSAAIPLQNSGTSLLVIAKDSSGNISDPAKVVVIDTTAPENPFINPVSDQNTSVSGTAEPRATVKLYVDGFYLGITKADLNGKYHFSITKQNAGTEIKVEVWDDAWNSSFTIEIVSDATPPEKPQINDVNDQSTTVSGMAEPSFTIKLYINSKLDQTMTADSTGYYSFNINQVKPDTEIKVIVEDQAGNRSESIIIVKDGTPPSAPAINQVTDQHSSVSGTTEPGATVKLYIDGVYLDQVIADSAGNFIFIIQSRKAGTIVRVTAEDKTGNESESSLKITDATPPSELAINPVTDQSTTVSGKTEAFALVKLYINGHYKGSIHAKDNGDFSFSINKPAAGAIILITAEDDFGNIKEKSLFVSDTTPPVKPTISPVTDKSTSVSGTTEAGVTVEMYINGKLQKSYLTQDGKFKFTISRQKAGTEIRVTSEDRAKNTSTTIVLVKDATAPIKPSIAAVSNLSSAVSGKTEAFAKVKLYFKGKYYKSTTADKYGDYRFTIAKQAAGTEVKVLAQDKAGNTSYATVKVLDKIPPAVPTINKVTYTSTSVTGKAEKGSVVYVYNERKKIGQATSNNKGKYSVKIKTQKKGSKLTIYAVDSAKNKSKIRKVKVY